MNILQINTIDTRGGASKVGYTLKRLFETEGHTTSLFVKIKYSKDKNVFIAKWPNPLSRLLKKITGKDVGSFLANKIRPLLANDIDYFGSDQILKTKEFRDADIIHCHNLHGNYFKLSTLVKMSKLKPIVWTLHDMWAVTPHCAHAFDGKARDGFFECPNLDIYQKMSWHNESYLCAKKKKIYASSNFTLVTPCLWLKEKVAQSVLRNKPLKVIYNGIDSAVFKNADKKIARENLGLPQDKKIILFVSPVGSNPQKGWEYVEAAMEQYKNRMDVLFLCVGTGEKTPDQEKRPYISVGFIDDENKLAEYYTAADVFLFTSKVETFPLVVLEAMSCGLPVVSFNVGGVKEAVIHKETGYIAEYLKGSDLINGIDYVLSRSEAEYEKMSQLARDRVLKNFTESLMAKNYLNLYRELLATRPQNP